MYFIYIDTGGWFGTMEFYDFPFSWEFHHPNSRTPFFRGVGIPPTRIKFGLSMINLGIHIWINQFVKQTCLPKWGSEPHRWKLANRKLDFPNQICLRLGIKH